MKIKVLKRKPFRILILFLCLIFIFGELSLRYFLGFCNAPLYIESDRYEYIPKPSQEGFRFGNHYLYNSFSQRNQEPDSTKIKILGLGDSVIHGGMQIDQDSLATSLFSAKNKNYQMLNISAGSWGPDNCALYLRENGTFDAKAFFLVVSSHDAHDNMTYKRVVGYHSSYPAEQYTMAWAELFDRYVIPKVKYYFSKKKSRDPDQEVLEGVGIHKEGKAFNSGFIKLKELADSLDIPLVVYLHADQAELKDGVYNAEGNEIISWAAYNQVKLIKELDYHFTELNYRDGIHMNNSGHRKLAEIMEDACLYN